MLAASLNILWFSLVASSPLAVSSGPTVATEDTMHTEVPEVLVRAPRVTLDEILDRVARGEARRDSMFTDQVFTATFRVVRGIGSKKGPSLLAETVARVYKKRPNRVRSVVIRHWEDGSKNQDPVEVTFRPDMSERAVNFAFRPEMRHEFRYHIVGRDLLGGHLIYRLAFEPRSLVDRSMPSGVVWVDTNDFVIVRQEVNFQRSPVPLFIKDVDRMVIERQRVDGYWVLRRILMRVESTIPLPKVGRSFDVTLQLDQYAINTGLNDDVFNPKAARR